MKLEPVCLVAPEEQATRRRSRRSFLALGLTATGSLLAGGTAGYTVARVLQAGRTEDGSAAPPVAAPQPAVPADLDESAIWLHRMAGPATAREDLLMAADRFLVLVAARESIDALMWQGVERIAQALAGVDAAAVPIPASVLPRMLARLAAQIIRSRAAADAPLRALLPRLLEVR